jgi:hypothetical protein
MGQKFFLDSIQTSSGAHPLSYTVGMGTVSLGVKWQGHETDHSPPFSVEVKNGGAIPLHAHPSS